MSNVTRKQFSKETHFVYILSTDILLTSVSNGDFSLIEESVKESRGFKTGKQCESVVIGYDYSQVIELIEQKLSTKNYDKLFLIGLDGYSLEQKSYFEKLIISFCIFNFSIRKISKN